MKVFAVIAAGGKGRRFGKMKQFVNFKELPLLVHTLKIFEKNKKIDSIIIVAPKGMLKKTEKIINNYGIKKVKRIIAGGRRRQDSVLNGIKTIAEKNAIVVIHDAVRPFVSQDLINRGINLCKRYNAVIFGLPIYDTVKLVNKRRVVKTLSRESLFAIQTPQFFKINLLNNAYKEVDFKKEFTDESAVLEQAGFPVYIFKGEIKNIKITTKEDLKFKDL
ncbi:MAG: 2-C-methyl-D-erythritol 4-phosphate cytidylyltransferase [candidate division WOR-3 bacterium]